MPPAKVDTYSGTPDTVSPGSQPRLLSSIPEFLSVSCHLVSMEVTGFYWRPIAPAMDAPLQRRHRGDLGQSKLDIQDDGHRNTGQVLGIWVRTVRSVVLV